MRTGQAAKGARTVLVAVRLGRGEARTLKRAARAAGVGISTYIRAAGMQAAVARLDGAMSVPPRHTAECGDKTEVAA